jgi:hypothetical protein
MAIERISNMSGADCNEIMRALIDGKNDREAAILAGAFLESMLFDILKDTIVDSIFQRANTLFDYPKPLSSFGGMLSLAYAFGRITNDEFNFARIVKKVRDLAAHSLTIRGGQEFTFSSQPVRELLREFNPKVMREQVPKEVRQTVESSYDALLDFDARLAFRLTFSCTVVSLLGRRALSDRLAPPLEINEGFEEPATENPS